MRIFLTGGSGFIGSVLAAKLRARGDDVVALCRSELAAAKLDIMGCEIIRGDLTDGVGFNRGVEGADAVIHAAARYEIGIPSQECPKMQDTNAGGTRRILDAAIEANVPRIVYVSTINVFGNTLGQVVDETFVRTNTSSFLSCYDESKFRAHQLAQKRVEKGAPVVFVLPGVVYGPSDHSEIGRQLQKAGQGTLGAVMFGDLGLSMVYVDDVAEGIVAALDKGKVGESYILGGENVRVRELLALAAATTGAHAPARELPTSWMRRLASFGPLAKHVLPAFGYPPNLHELLNASDGATYWVKSDKAIAELGFSSRSLEEGLQLTLPKLPG